MISDIHIYDIQKNTPTDICTLVNIEAHTHTGTYQKAHTVSASRCPG